MKKIIFTGQMFAVLFLFFACSSSEANSNTGGDNATIEIATNNKEQVKESPAASGQVVSTSTSVPQANVVPPKHATKDELIASIIDKVNASSSPLSTEQEENIRAIAGRYNITVFPDMVSYRKLKKRITQVMQKEVLTEKQLKVFPEKNK